MQIRIEGMSADELLAMPTDAWTAIVLTGKPIAFRAGTAEVLGRFEVRGDCLVVELAHIDGGGEGVLPTISVIADRFARREKLREIEWRVHAVNCARPNLKLRRVLERRGFTIRMVPGVGECYFASTPVQESRDGKTFPHPRAAEDEENLKR